MSKSTFILFFCVLFSLNNLLFAQTPPYYHYTLTEGLSSLTVFDILQDRNGYIWCATSNGISRFDGHRFKNYGLKEGLNSNVITSIAEGNEGEIYIANYEKGINILKNGNITNYTKSDDKPIFINYIFLEQNKLFGYAYQGLFSYNNGFSEQNITFGGLKDFKNNNIVINRIIRVSDGKLLASTSDGFYIIEDKNYEKINIVGFEDSEVYCTVESRNGNLYAGSNGKIYLIKNYNVIKIIKTGFADDKITAILIDSMGNIWFSIFNRGFYVIPAGSDNIFDIGAKLKLGKAVVNDFCEDTEGNLWVSSMGKGVFCLNNFYINNYSEDDGLTSNSVQAIEKDRNGRILLGTMNGINILDDGKFGLLEIGAKNILTDYIQEMKLINGKVYVSTSFPNRNVINRFYKNTEFVLFSGNSFCVTKNSDCLIGSSGNSIYINKNITNTFKPANDKLYFTVIGDEIQTNRVNKIFEDSESNLWVGTTLGLCRIKNNEKKLYPENEILNSAVKSIIQDNRNRVWFAGEKGIANYNYEDTIVTGFKDIAGYDITSSTSLAVDKNDRIWIGNRKGLYILENNSIKLINTTQGLPSNEVLSLYYDKENNVMWIGTSGGFSSLDINLFDNYKPLPLKIIIDNVSAGDSVFSRFDNLKFEHDNNNIHIGFSVLNFSSPSGLKYQYRLNKGWIDTENDYLDFSSMEHGSHEISFRAKSQNGEWSKPSVVSFIIEPKFTDTVIFQLFMIVFFFGIVLFTAKYLVNNNIKKSEAKIENTKKMSELEHQALSAMMNPHFIFNSLNSVQYLVNKGRNEEANDYISILSKLIRKNLDTAGDSFILLDEEINRLTLYLQIEKLRFQDKFSYEINAGEDVNIESVMIPNMIIQPFVENAVWYGIMNSGKKGFVKISFRFEDVNIESNISRCLVIKITDNGIGLKQSAEKKKEGHVSKGIKIIEERLRLLSQNLDIPKPVIIEDLSLRNENSTGTEVILTLPNTLYRNISE